MNPAESQPRPLGDSGEAARAVSVVIPAFNEERGIAGVLTAIARVLTTADWQYELLVVDDGSTDRTAVVAREHQATVITHPHNLGYGRSLKTGIEYAQHDLILITDADGTYPVEPIPELLALAGRYHMVVAQRTGATYYGSAVKRVGRHLFRWLAEYATGHTIADINSGLRVFRRSDILPFFPSISTGFSFTTTSTLVYLLNELLVKHVPIDYQQRIGASKVRYFTDTIRALQIVLEAILRYNPIKVFLLVAGPLVVAGLVFLLTALLAGAPLLGLAGLLALLAAAIVLSHGFLSVSLVPTRRGGARRRLEQVSYPAAAADSPVHDVSHVPQS